MLHDDDDAGSSCNELRCQTKNFERRGVGVGHEKLFIRSVLEIFVSGERMIYNGLLVVAKAVWSHMRSQSIKIFSPEKSSECKL